MKNTKLLELFFGLVTLITAIVHYYNFELPETIWLDEHSPETNYGLKVVCAFVLPFIFVAFGSVWHALRGSFSGFIILMISGGFLTLYYGIVLFSLGAFYHYGVGGGVLYVMPGFFVAATLFFAVRSRRSELLSNQKEI